MRKAHSFFIHPRPPPKTTVRILARYFITGGTGFIGRWLASRLLAEGNEVVIYDANLDRGAPSHAGLGKVRTVKGSVTDSETISRELHKARPDVVVHYAALLSASAESDPETAYQVDVASTWPLFEAVRKADVPTVLFASSASVYGPGGSGLAKEDRYHIPSTIYAISKMYGEMIGSWFNRTYGIDFAAFRYASVIGPGRGEGGASAFTSLMIEKVAKGESYEVQVPESARLPIVYVKDAIDATLYVNRKIRSIRLEEKVFNVCGITPGPSAGEIARVVRKRVPNADIRFRRDESISKIVDTWAWGLSTSRLDSVGWKPLYNNLEKLIDDFIREVGNKQKLKRGEQ